MGSGLFYVIGQYLSIKPCPYGWLQNCDSKANFEKQFYMKIKHYLNTKWTREYFIKM